MTLTQGWACLTEGCLESGAGPTSDKTAEKHGKAFGHSTHSWMKDVKHGQAADAQRDGSASPGTQQGKVREVPAPSATGSAAPPAAEGDGRVVADPA